MSIGTDPLDLAIEISPDEWRHRTLSTSSARLGALILSTRGYVVLKNAIDIGLVDDLREHYWVLFEYSREQRAMGLDRTSDDEIRRGAAFFWERAGRFRISPRLEGPFLDRQVLRNPFADALMSALLGADYYCKFVSSDTCVKGSVLQPPHRDIDFYESRGSSGYLVNIPLVHCGLHNGPLEVWPGGSHLYRSGVLNRFDLHPFTQDGDNVGVEQLANYLPSKKLEFGPGDVLIRDPGMWHRGTPNVSEDPRIMLTAGYFRRRYHYRYGDVSHNLDEQTYQSLPADIAGLFSPHFDRTGPRYWRNRRDRLIGAVEGLELTSRALSSANRIARRAKNARAAHRAVRG